jgi:hypothetical protein
MSWCSLQALQLALIENITLWLVAIVVSRWHQSTTRCCCDCSSNGQKWSHTVAMDMLISVCPLLLFFTVSTCCWCQQPVVAVQSWPSPFKHVDFWPLDGSQWLKSFQFSNRNPNPTTVIEPPVSLRLASTSFHSLSTISTLYLSVFPNGSHGGPSHRCTHAPRSHTAASRGSSLVPSLSLSRIRWGGHMVQI